MYAIEENIIMYGKTFGWQKLRKRYTSVRRLLQALECKRRYPITGCIKDGNGNIKTTFMTIYRPVHTYETNVMNDFK